MTTLLILCLFSYRSSSSLSSCPGISFKLSGSDRGLGQDSQKKYKQNSITFIQYFVLMRQCPYTGCQLMNKIRDFNQYTISSFKRMGLLRDNHRIKPETKFPERHNHTKGNTSKKNMFIFERIFLSLRNDLNSRFTPYLQLTPSLCCVETELVRYVISKLSISGPRHISSLLQLSLIVKW